MGTIIMNNFDKGTPVENIYLGSEIKTRYILNGTYYMIKIPNPVREKNMQLSYMNNQYSEYIGCHIYDLIGVPVQKTILGTITINGVEKVAVGCADFNYSGMKRIHDLYELDTIANWLNTEERFQETIECAYLFFDKKENLNRAEAVKRFWDMFVIDALIMNKDRHFRNIGYWLENGVLVPAPVYDCGSSLGALYSEDKIKELMNNKVLFKEQVYNVPSCYRMNGKRLFFNTAFKDPNIDLAKSIVDIYPRINLNEINNMIDNTPFINNLRKCFFKSVVTYNYKNMLESAFYKIQKSFANEVKEATAKQEAERDASASSNKIKGMSIPEK